MAKHDPPAIIEKIRELFDTKGSSIYAGEPVTQTEHAMQAAFAAEQTGESPESITAALLHDIGHLLHKHDENCAEEGIDDLHESIGAQWLVQFFPVEVTEPIRLHVAAKRYRCAIDAEYHSQLSPASILSLRLQGGPFEQQERTTFESNPWHEAALRLRSWDEAAKIPRLETPELDHFLIYVKRVLEQQNQSIQ